MLVLETYNESINMIISGITVIAAIAWRDVISYFIDQLVEKQNTIFYKVLYAMIMTFIGLITINFLKPRLTVKIKDIGQLIGHLVEKEKIQEEPMV